MNLLALDVSTKSTGYAIFSNRELISYGCITASSTDKIKRIFKIVKEIDEIITTFKIDKVVLEEVIIRPGIQTKTYTALMYVQAAIMFMLYQNHPKITTETLYPSEWRKKCGIKTGPGIKRDALKIADITFARDKIPETMSLNDDEADAIAIGCGYLSDKTNDSFDWT